MLVKDWMSKGVISLDVTDKLQHAIKHSMESHISIMPVLENGKLVGIVTDRDLKRASPSAATSLDMQEILYHLSRVEVGAIMSRYPIRVQRSVERLINLVIKVLANCAQAREMACSCCLSVPFCQKLTCCVRVSSD